MVIIFYNDQKHDLQDFKIEISKYKIAQEIFVENYAYEESLKILQEHKKVIISGIVRVGKSILCKNLALFLYNTRLNKDRNLNNESILKKLFFKNKNSTNNM